MGHNKLLAQVTHGVIFHRRTVLRERKRQRLMSKNRGKKRQYKIFKKPGWTRIRLASNANQTEHTKERQESEQESKR